MGLVKVSSKVHDCVPSKRRNIRYYGDDLTALILHVCSNCHPSLTRVAVNLLMTRTKLLPHSGKAVSFFGSEVLIGAF
jgi:ribosomal protein L32